MLKEKQNKTKHETQVIRQKGCIGQFSLSERNLKEVWHCIDMLLDVLNWPGKKSREDCVLKITPKYKMKALHHDKLHHAFHLNFV